MIQYPTFFFGSLKHNNFRACSVVPTLSLADFPNRSQAGPWDRGNGHGTGGMVEETLLHVDKYVYNMYIYIYTSCMNVDMMYAYKFNMIPVDIIAEPHMIDMELSWEMSYDAPSLAHTSHITWGVRTWVRPQVLWSIADTSWDVQVSEPHKDCVFTLQDLWKHCWKIMMQWTFRGENEKVFWRWRAFATSLVGFNPLEKYDRPIGNLPQFSG